MRWYWSTANICAFGWKARDFALKSVDVKTYCIKARRNEPGEILGIYATAYPKKSVGCDLFAAPPSIPLLGKRRPDVS
jgi:hypothetical protein